MNIMAYNEARATKLDLTPEQQDSAAPVLDGDT